jgi:quercetin dioxygenase-like cupin family protein
MKIKRQRIDDIVFHSAPNRIVGEVFSRQIFGAKEVTFRFVELAPASEQEPRRPHWHEGFEEVIHFLQGRGRIWADGEWHDVTSGDTILIPPGVHHATFNLGEEPMRLLCFFPRPEIDPVSFADEFVTLEGETEQEVVEKES